VRTLLLLALTLVVGCPAAGPSDDDDSATAEVTPKFGSEFAGGDRPVFVQVPDGYDGLTLHPLVILLHGYGASGDLQDIYFRYGDRVSLDGFFLLAPDGTRDSSGTPFWNARPTSPEPIDDVAYLTGLVDEMLDEWAIDPARVYFAGHSNGGYMSYRLACEIPDRMAAILNFAGLSPYEDDAACSPSEPVSVLHVHGTEDADVPYAPTDGRMGAEDLAALWADRASCGAGPTEGGRLDLIDGIAGDETRTEDWSECAPGTAVSFWALEEGGHLPFFNGVWAESTLAWLLAQRKGGE